MRAVLWMLTIFLAAFGGAILIDTLKSSYVSDAGFRYFIGLVTVLAAAAIYARKLHRAEPKQS